MRTQSMLIRRAPGMEEGCFCDLPLEGNPKLEDRGHSMGVGSLDVYKVTLPMPSLLIEREQHS